MVARRTTGGRWRAAAAGAALAARGLTPVLDITEVGPLGVKVMYYQDPEGNAIEIAQKVAG